MSNGASSLYEKPLRGYRVAATKRPNRTGSHRPRAPRPSKAARPSRRSCPSAAGAERREPRGPDGASGLEGHVVLIDAEQRPVSPTCAAIFTEWPAPPRVQSQTTEPLFSRSDSSTSPSMTGSCRYSCVKIPRSIRYPCLALTRRRGPAGPHRHRPHRPRRDPKPQGGRSCPQP